MDLKKLAEPFPAEDIEWRVGQSGEKNGKPWAKVLAYVTARAIMNRLDDVCGPEDWSVDYAHIEGGVMCHLNIRCSGEAEDHWVSKSDGAQPTEFEPFKGAISGALKRAGAVWGIGRYLYKLDQGWAECTTKKDPSYPNWAKTKDGTSFYWKPPALPAWALPGGKVDGVATARGAERILEQRAAKPDPAEDVLLTAAQQKRIHALRREAGIEEKDYREVLARRYSVSTSSDLPRYMASELIKRLEKRAKQVSGQDAEETFSGDPRVKKLRETLVGYCAKLKSFGEKTARGEKIDYGSYGLGIGSVAELVDLAPSMTDEKELEGLIQKLDNLFAEEIF